MRPDAACRLGCTSSIFTERKGIDNACPNEGCSDASSAKGLQNLVKNNLCRVETPYTLSFAEFVSLQMQAADMHISFGATYEQDGTRIEHLPEDRTALTSGRLVLNGRPLREGDMVRMVA